MITFINSRGQSVMIGNPPFKLIEFDPGRATTSMQTGKSANQDGELYLDNFLEPRDMSIELFIEASDMRQRRELERILDQVFNPKLGEGKLIHEEWGERRAIMAVPDGSPQFLKGKENKTPKARKVSIPLIAHHPYWGDVDETKQEIALWKGAFGFPWEIPAGEGVELGYREPSLIVNCYNPGDHTCGMRIVFKAQGTVTNPSLLNVNTREYIKLNKTMQDGEVITVTTYYGAKRVEMTKGGITTNIFQYLDFPGSSFIQLYPGDNLFRYDAEKNLEFLNIDIYYTPQYLGA
ncbi:phage tail family protein [Paenibacillus larvae]|uniref:phage tail family protein n=1 Tax=Paenibacillus larvae TaxID=1464 RepID=UPI00069C86D7|nr:phage tail family protein [Paenibacillus larvae]